MIKYGSFSFALFLSFYFLCCWHDVLFILWYCLLLYNLHGSFKWYYYLFHVFWYYSLLFYIQSLFGFAIYVAWFIYYFFSKYRYIYIFFFLLEKSEIGYCLHDTIIDHYLKEKEIEQIHITLLSFIFSLLFMNGMIISISMKLSISMKFLAVEFDSLGCNSNASKR